MHNENRWKYFLITDLFLSQVHFNVHTKRVSVAVSSWVILNTFRSPDSGQVECMWQKFHTKMFISN